VDKEQAKFAVSGMETTDYHHAYDDFSQLNTHYANLDTEDFSIKQQKDSKLTLRQQSDLRIQEIFKSIPPPAIMKIICHISEDLDIEARKTDGGIQFLRKHSTAFVTEKSPIDPETLSISSRIGSIKTENVSSNVAGENSCPVNFSELQIKEEKMDIDVQDEDLLDAIKMFPCNKSPCRIGNLLEVAQERQQQYMNVTNVGQSCIENYPDMVSQGNNSCGATAQSEQYKPSYEANDYSIHSSRNSISRNNGGGYSSSSMRRHSHRPSHFKLSNNNHDNYINSQEYHGGINANNKRFACGSNDQTSPQERSRSPLAVQLDAVSSVSDGLISNGGNCSPYDSSQAAVASGYNNSSNLTDETALSFNIEPPPDISSRFINSSSVLSIPSPVPSPHVHSSTSPEGSPSNLGGSNISSSCNPHHHHHHQQQQQRRASSGGCNKPYRMYSSPLSGDPAVSPDLSASPVTPTIMRRASCDTNLTCIRGSTLLHSANNGSSPLYSHATAGTGRHLAQSPPQQSSVHQQIMTMSIHSPGSPNDCSNTGAMLGNGGVDSAHMRASPVTGYHQQFQQHQQQQHLLTTIPLSTTSPHNQRQQHQERMHIQEDRRFRGTNTNTNKFHTSKDYYRSNKDNVSSHPESPIPHLAFSSTIFSPSPPVTLITSTSSCSNSSDNSMETFDKSLSLNLSCLSDTESVVLQNFFEHIHTHIMQHHQDGKEWTSSDLLPKHFLEMLQDKLRTDRG
jgi:hypothetical protein